MKIENWDTLKEQGFRYIGNKEWYKGKSKYFKKVCKTCNIFYMGKKSSLFCCRKCRRATNESKSKMSKSRKGKKISKEIKVKLSEFMKEQWSDPNSIFNSKKHKKILSKRMKEQWSDPNSIFNSKTYKEKILNRNIGFPGELNPSWKGGYYIKNIPMYDTYVSQLEWCEEVRRSPTDRNILEVRCTYCGRWFIPSRIYVTRRLQALKDQITGYQNFYCSEGCKQACPLYQKSPDQLMKEDAIRASRLGWLELNREVQPELRKLVLERDGYQCTKCSSKGPLHCHHIYPVATDPLESADMDNCITLCIDCHKKVHKKDGCKYGELKICIEYK